MRLELFRLAPKGNIKIESIVNGGGNLKLGSYQFAYRLVNKIDGRNTKFSNFTHPIAIASSNGLGDQGGALNTFSNKSIELSISVDTEELSLYTTIELAVLENTSGQFEITNAVSIAGETPIQGESNKFIYNFNERINVLDRAEVVIDDAPIKTAKTLTVKNSRLALGNIQYKNLLFDNGTPSVTTGEIITRRTPMVGSSGKSALESKGYFSGEVYRYYITFWDEYGDYSIPVALDMRNVSGNQIDSALPFQDFKFPKRDSNNKFIDVEEKGTPQEAVFALNKGLSITVNNIPSWAKGASILRAKRKKDILFQSPLIPTTVIQSPDAQGDFPGEAKKAPSPIGTIAPKNMNFSLNKAITSRAGTSGFTRDQIDWSANYEGFEFCKKMHVAFPPEVIMNNSGVPYFSYVKNGNLTLEAVDYCMLAEGNGDLLSRNLTASSGTDFSNDSQRSSSTTLTACKPYYYASNRLLRSVFESQIIASDRKVEDIVNSFALVPSGVEGIPIIGSPKNAPTSNFGAYRDLEISPASPANGISPSTQRCVILTTQNERPDPSYYSLAPGSAAGYITSEVFSAETENGSPLTLDPARIKPVTGQASNPDYTVSNHFIEIVNFKIGLSDDRYGVPSSQNELVATGAYTEFETPPSTIQFEVFGGDCFISPFTFKVHDSHYAVVNSGLWGDTAANWGGEAFSVNSSELRRPMPYRSMAASIGVYLESEVNSLFSEEFLTKGNNDIYNPIIPTIYTFSGSSVFGRIYSHNGRFYRALRTASSIDEPGSLIGSGVNKVTNIGYDFEDFGSSLSGVFYPYRRPIDLFFVNTSFSEAKSPMNYLYNPEYSFEDGSKPFPFIFNEDNFNRTNFKSRVAYSDTKILQTIFDGFSRVRVANIYDLDESIGSLTKLLVQSGRMYGIQERGFCYIPFEANIIETADGNSLAIQSGQIIGIPQYIEDYGSRYIRSVKNTPSGLTFFDVDNSKIILFSGDLSHVNDLGVSKYIETKSNALRPLKIADKDVQTYFDYNRDEIVFKFGNEAMVLDTKASAVKTFIKPGSSVTWDYGFYNDSDHYIIGSNNLSSSANKNKLLVSTINSSTVNKNILGAPFSSSFKFVINDKPYFNKMFYLVKFITQGEEDVVMNSFKNGVQSSSYSATTEEDRRAGFLLNKIRDQVKDRRLRGDYATVESTLTNNEVAMAITKLQASYRIM